jgi:hypothetical protein
MEESVGILTAGNGDHDPVSLLDEIEVGNGTSHGMLYLPEAEIFAG